MLEDDGGDLCRGVLGLVGESASWKRKKNCDEIGRKGCGLWEILIAETGFERARRPREGRLF
jgi:hypothetical protein